MTAIAYYPGCSLKTSGQWFERSARAAATALDIELQELERWNCCGTVFSSASDDRVHHLASLRNLVRVQETGHDEVVTLCAMCFGTLSQVNRLVAEDPAEREAMNGFMDREENYRGGVRVHHFLTLLRERVGQDGLRSRLRRPLHGLRVAPYYGCTLLRPPEIGIDDPDEPRLMEDLIEALGAEVVSDPLRVECCGAYLAVSRPEAVAVRSRAIVESAAARGAEVVAVTCPLCFHNLDTGAAPAGSSRPLILYFTQLLALALDCEPETYLDPRTCNEVRQLLAAKGLAEERIR